MYYIGTLCKHGHKHENTDGSLRYKKNKQCIVCNNNSVKKYQKTEKFREERKRAQKKYCGTEKYRKAREKYQKTEKFREAMKSYKKKWYRKSNDTMSDSYISGLICRQFGIKYSNVLPEMIELKRYQVALFREIKKVKEVL
jgi:hypothetical protein